GEVRQSRSACAPPKPAVSSAMIAKVGVAPRHSQSAAPREATPSGRGAPQAHPPGEDALMCPLLSADGGRLSGPGDILECPGRLIAIVVTDPGHRKGLVLLVPALGHEVE